VSKAIFRVAYLLPIIVVLQSPWQPVSASSINCDESPLTRLESSICSDPALRALDAELSQTLKHAKDSNVLSLAQVRRVRNAIARQCRRETDANLQNCLLNAELGAFEQFAGEHAVIGESVRGKQLQRSVLLARQLDVARRNLRATGNAHLTVTTIVELLKISEEHRGSIYRSQSANIENLRLQLVNGCHHQDYADSWQVAVKANGLQCTTLEQQPPVYGLSDFD